MMGFGKRMKLCRGLWVCLKVAPRILKHNIDDDNKTKQNKTNQNKTKNNNTLWQSTAHSDLQSAVFEDKQEFQYVRKVTVMMLLFL